MPLNEREQAAFEAAMKMAPCPERVTDTSMPEKTWFIDYEAHDLHIFTAALAVAAEQRAEDRKVMEQVRDLLTHVNEVGVHPFAERGIMLALAAIRARLEVE